jgi:hypothetical protein
MKLLCVLLVAVSANAATSLDVQMPHTSTTGIAFNVTVTARQSGVTDTGYSGTVHFTSDDPKAVLPPDYTFVPADAGTHTFSATMNSAGPSVGTANHALTATDTANSTVRGVNGTTVRWNDNVVRTFSITAPAEVDRTVPFQVEVRALNASNMLMPSYTGTITFVAYVQETVPPDYTFTPADAGRHTFSITANRGYQSRFNVQDVSDSDVFGGLFEPVSVQCPELVAMASNNGPVCPNSRAMLFGSANLPVTSYAWTFFTPSGHRPFISSEQNIVGGPGTYGLAVFQSNDCVATAQTTVTVRDPEPTQVTLSTNAICGSGNLRATITNASQYSNLNWTAAGGTIVSGQGTPSVEIAADSGSTKISLSLGATETSSGCDASRFVADVPVGSVVAPTISTVPETCAQVVESASVTDAGSGATYAWTISNGAITSGAGTRTIQYVPNGAGDVTLSATVMNGSCNGTGTAVVSFADTPEITVQPHGMTIHSGETATLTVGVSGGNVRYRWYEGSAGDRTKFVGFNPTFTTKTLSATTSYWVEVENDCGSVQSLTAVVVVSNAAGKRRAVMH